MQLVTEPIQNINTIPPHQEQSSFDDQEAEDLFNQIEIDENLNKNQDHQQQQKNPFDQLEQKPKTPKKIIKKKMMELDSDNVQQQNNQNPQQRNQQRGKFSKKNKKQRKLEKKLRKKLKKQKKLKKKRNQSKLRKVNQQKEGEQNKKPQLSQDWSGQSQNQQLESNLSSDSLLQRLNPSKKKNKSHKKQSAEKKQGFLLKQLGNDAQVNYQNGQEPNDDSSYDSNNKKKKNRVKDKVQKKQISKNQQILKSLLQIGLCMGQENDEQNKNQGQIDNGLEQVYNMKNTKKKGPKIANKFFSDMQIKLDDEDEKNQPLPKQIQLQIKPRIRQGGPSLISSSFLSKVQKIRKVRGMESEMLHQQYQKMISLKAKQSMVKLINQKQLQQAEQIDLEVKVPEVIRGKGELNNSMFLKRISSGSMYQSKQSLQGREEINKKENEKKIKNNSKTKLTRFDFFRSMSDDLKARKSRDISEEFIKNSFKVTQLEEIQQMRKKNQQKRRKQALKGSDDQSEQQQEDKKQQMIENNLGFMNFRVQVQKQPLDKEKQILVEDKNEEVDKIQDQQKQVNQNIVQGIKKTQSFCIEIKKDVLPDDQYKRLLLLEEGMQPEQENNQQQQDENENENENEQLNQILNGPKHAQEQIDIQNQEDKVNEDQQQNIDELQLNSAEKIDLEVELEVVSSQNNQQNSQQQEQEEEANQSIENRQQPINEQYQEYLNQLQAEGIKINKRHQNRRKQGRSKQDLQGDQKQNDKLIQNKKLVGNLQAEGQELNEARRQFKKLRKLATIIKQKKQIELKTQRARQFYDQQAEEGSDNEEHDHEVKKINYDDEAEEYEGIDLDADLQQMIDNAVDINEEDQQLAFRKYMEDVKIQDREQIKRIMKGDFKRRRDHEPMMDEMDEDQKKRVQRMEQFEEYIKKKQMQQGQDLYMDENQSNKQDQEDSAFDDDSEDEKQREKAEIQKKKIPVQSTQQQQYQLVDQMNQQNLMRYLDDAIVDNWRSVVKVKRQIIQIPQSCQRQKKTQMRNTMKPKGFESGVPSKLKKTSSHLNEMIMKNKQKIKPIIFTKNFSVLNRR